jgi:hypothetical protein
MNRSKATQGMKLSQSGLPQLVRFLVVKLNHLGSNPKFDMRVIFMANYSFSGRRRPIDNETFLILTS